MCVSFFLFFFFSFLSRTKLALFLLYSLYSLFFVQKYSKTTAQVLRWLIYPIYKTNKSFLTISSLSFPKSAGMTKIRSKHTAANPELDTPSSCLVDFAKLWWSIWLTISEFRVDLSRHAYNPYYDEENNAKVCSHLEKQ